MRKEARTAVVFGGTGFLGHAVVQILAQAGYVVRVPTRDLEKAKDLKVMGAPGQIVPLLASIRSDVSVATVLSGADVVVNLIGVRHEKSGLTFQTAHVETAARLARLARSEGVKRFVHVSALGAAIEASSRYARSKAVGEEAVRAFFPTCVILRPAIMFGPRDRFLNQFARAARFFPILPLVSGGYNRMQPVYVGDVALAVWAVLEKREAAGRIFALGGPKKYYFQDVALLLLRCAGLRRWMVSFPTGAAKLVARLAECLPAPPLTRDQIERFRADCIVNVRPSAPLAHWRGIATIEMLGIRPRAMEEILPTYLERPTPSQP